MDLRYYLTFGLLLTALADFMFGLGHTMGVHEVTRHPHDDDDRDDDDDDDDDVQVTYFYVMMAFLGMVNSSGWSGVVTTLSNWLGKTGFGTLFGKVSCDWWPDAHL